MFKTNDTVGISVSTVQETINYIEDNILEELTPAIIAAHFYISVSTLSGLFKITSGMTIMEYIRNRRLTLAAEELIKSDIHIIDLALKYGYETPEAFTKAFSRFHGFPPSFVRRAFPVTRIFRPMHISVMIQGGWDTEVLTKPDSPEQDHRFLSCYDNLTNPKGGIQMERKKIRYQIDTGTMQYKEEWNILCSLARKLVQNHVPFKVDGKTMIFAHGLEFPLEKICLTFKWEDEDKIRGFFSNNPTTRYVNDGFRYFDAKYEGMYIRCMFYGNCSGDDTDEFLYSNTDLVQIDELEVPVQSLEFYYENAERGTECYKMVENYLGKEEKRKKRI